MQEAFEVVIFAVVILAAVVGIAGFASRGRAYDEIGRGGLSIDRAPPAPSTAAARDAEIRQLLDAANDRRIRRGQAPLDVGAELARLTGAADPGLEAEVRALVVARNERRARNGKPPLDVETEVRRALTDRT
jgi:hypothetical protein